MYIMIEYDHRTDHQTIHAGFPARLVDHLLAQYPTPLPGAGKTTTRPTFASRKPPPPHCPTDPNPAPSS